MKRNRFLVFLIVACMLVAILPTYVFATPIYFNQGDFKYRTNSAQDAAIIVGVNDGVKIKNLVLPETVTYNEKTYEVYAIDNDAFANNLDIESVVMPNTYTTLLINTFYGCKNLKDVSLSSNLTGGMTGTFQYCSNLKECVIPGGVTALTNTFKNCVSIEKVEVPASVTTFSGVFDNCNKAMNTIHIITPPGSNAETYFKQLGCKVNDDPVIHPINFAVGDFKYRTNTAGTKAILKGFNDGVTGTNIVLPQSVTYNGTTYEVYAIDNDAFAYNEDIESVVMPDTYTTLLINTFFGCKNLNTVTLSKNLTGEMTGTFQYCSGLKECVIPGGVTALTNTFRYCTNIEKLDVPASVESVSGIFDGCNKEMSTINITAPKGSYAETYFKDLGCRVNGETPKVTGFEVDDFKYSIITDTETVLVTGFSSASDKSGAKVLPETVTHDGTTYTVVKVGYAAFANCNDLTSFVMSDTVIGVDSNIFYGCKNLSYVHLSDNLTNAPNRQLVGTFYGCTALKTVVVPQGIGTLSKTFINSGIENVILKAKFTEIPGKEYVPFSNYDTVKVFYASDATLGGTTAALIKNTFIYEGSIAYKLKEDNTLKAVSVLPSYSLEGDITIPSVVGALQVTEIGDEAFANADEITSVSIPETIIVIGARAFADCDNLEDFELPNSITGELDNTFAGCTKLETATIPEGVTGLNGTFTGCTSLTNVKFASTVSTISNKAFYNCASFAEIPVPDTVTSITDGENPAGTVFPDGCTLIVQENSAALEYAIANDINYVIKQKVEYTVKGNNAEVSKTNFRLIGEYTIPDTVTINGILYNVTEIADNAFENQDALTVLSIPDSIAVIGNNAFDGCTNADFAIRVNSNTSAYAKVKTMNISYIADDAQSGLAYKKYEGKEGLEVYSAAKNVELKDAVAISSFDGIDIVSIGEKAFAGQTGITSIVMTDTITSIGKYAFENCDKLSWVTLSTNVAGILDSTFVGCSSLENADIPIGITELKNTYNGCTSLTRVIIPESVIGIYDKTFANCTDLETVVIPDTVTVFDRIVGFKDETKEEAEYVETNTSKKWVDNPFMGATNENLAICGVRGSAAEEFAYSSGIKFIDIAKGDYNPEYFDNGDKTFNVSIRDIYGEGDVTIIGALYNGDNELIQCHLVSTEFNTNDCKTVFAKNMEFADYSENTTLKFMVWDDLTSLTPVNDVVTAKTPEPIKILVLGNSISNHGPSESNGWFPVAPDPDTNTYQAMAATSSNKDFAHIVLQKAREVNKNVEMKIVTCWSLESDFDKWETLIPRDYKEAVDYDADIIIAQFGENIKNNAGEGTISGSFDNDNVFDSEVFAKIVKAFAKPGKDVPVVVTTSMMTNNSVVLEAKQKAATDNGWAYVNLCNDKNFSESKNSAYYLTPNQIVEGLANGTFHEGVTIGDGVYIHPGNNGMRAIAYGIWRYLEPIINEMTYNN